MGCTGSRAFDASDLMFPDSATFRNSLTSSITDAELEKFWTFYAVQTFTGANRRAAMHSTLTSTTGKNGKLPEKCRHLITADALLACARRTWKNSAEIARNADQIMEGLQLEQALQQRNELAKGAQAAADLGNIEGRFAALGR